MNLELLSRNRLTVSMENLIKKIRKGWKFRDRVPIQWHFASTKKATIFSQNTKIAVWGTLARLADALKLTSIRFQVQDLMILLMSIFLPREDMWVPRWTTASLGNSLSLHVIRLLKITKILALETTNCQVSLVTMSLDVPLRRVKTTDVLLRFKKVEQISQLRRLLHKRWVKLRRHNKKLDFYDYFCMNYCIKMFSISTRRSCSNVNCFGCTSRPSP